MFGKLKSLFKSKTSVEEVEKFDDALRLRVDSFVEFDEIPFSMLEDQTNFGLAPANQKIAAVGKVDLGQQVMLHRYYFDDDETWLQVNTNGGNKEVEEVILWKYWKTDSPTSRAELNALTDENSGLGLPTLNVEGKVYERVWGTSRGYSEFVEFTEEVHKDTDTTPEYKVRHRSMLYRRPLLGTDRMEFYLISIEDNDGVNVVHSIGITLSLEDIKNY